MKSVYEHKYPTGCSNFHGHCKNRKNCGIFDHYRKPYDIISVPFTALRTDYLLTVFKKDENYLYLIYEERGDEIKPITTEYYSKLEPDELSNGNEFIRKLENLLKRDYQGERAKEEKAELLNQLKEKLKSYQQDEEDYRRKQKIISHEKMQNEIEKGGEILRNIKNPLQYIGSIADYLAAGERANILIGVLAFIHLIARQKGVNYIATGESASGKTMIVQAAMKMIPEKSVEMDTPTKAAMYNYSQENEWHYHKKVVYFGDLGGETDLKDTDHPRNILKNMESEKYVSKTISIKEEGDTNYRPKKLILRGSPAVCYTTVHMHEIPEQESNRGFIVNPRSDNGKMVNVFTTSKMHEGGFTSQIMEKIEKEEIENVRKIFLFLEKIGPKLKIINPYSQYINKWIEGSFYEKREFGKLLNICNMITLINYFNRTRLEIDGKHYLVTHPNDVKYLFELLGQYRMAMLYDLPKPEIDLYKKIRREYGTDEVFTRKEIVDLTKLQYRTVVNYMSNLTYKGILEKTGDRDGRAYLYRVVETIEEDEIFDEIELNAKCISELAHDYPEDVVKAVVNQSGELDGSSVYGWELKYPVPRWEKYEPSKYIKKMKR